MGREKPKQAVGQGTPPGLHGLQRAMEASGLALSRQPGCRISCVTRSMEISFESAAFKGSRNGGSRVWGLADRCGSW